MGLCAVADRSSWQPGRKKPFLSKISFLDQISRRPCRPDMSLGFILSMRIYSDGHCKKTDVMYTIVMKFIV
jgi:hypothetical protein